ncbi:hypothetical protein AWM75_05110 [Aerococcus urinaehominis]|uniref:Uncharacterized protein n=1 Tax=Aerococcus urinaehominis TaxID=128944 RepID=A0A0X8FLC1_9LACT|nr:hypothetical protein [Aerococcus urinaehominis]AMB99410.1 hypothetical protein AWM75_05110 [Aerococcus urinaehominis]SDM24300.1 hypothetical protein SAMN04487985_10967 [Aerococcus urinaehominis]
MAKRKKANRGLVIIMGILAVVVIASVGVYASRVINVDKNAGLVQTDKYAELRDRLDSLYYDESKVFLKENITADEIEAVGKEVAKADDKELKDQFADLETRFDALSQTNNLFDKIDGQVPLNGATMLEYVRLKDNATEKDIKKVEKAFAKQLKDTDEDGFYKVIASLLDQAKQQEALFTEVNKQIEDLKKNKDLTYEDLADQLADLRQEINKMDNNYVKARLLRLLGEADRDLTKLIGEREVKEAEDRGLSKEEVEKRRQEAEARARQAENRQRELNQQSQTVESQAPVQSSQQPSLRPSQPASRRNSQSQAPANRPSQASPSTSSQASSQEQPPTPAPEPSPSNEPPADSLKEIELPEASQPTEPSQPQPPAADSGESAPAPDSGAGEAPAGGETSTGEAAE